MNRSSKSSKQGLAFKKQIVRVLSDDQLQQVAAGALPGTCTGGPGPCSGQATCACTGPYDPRCN